ncbi:MAG: hypothetical protein AYK22_00605 [Thermoplasmatales archaeon SG8-52-3]|nr:MAG: hypothetical protein AYK22_00605 [Thermoplasmatales archaeon SG8-52-3]
MNKNPVFLYKTLVVGIITLFLSIGTQPCIAIQFEEEINVIQAPPVIEFIFEILGDNWVAVWVVAMDEISGMDRLEIYFNGNLKEIFYSNGSLINEVILEFKYPPVPFIIIKAVGYDNAGNRAEASINLREYFSINRSSRDNFYNNFLQNDFFKKIIDRFLLLKVFLSIIEISR